MKANQHDSEGHKFVETKNNWFKNTNSPSPCSNKNDTNNKITDNHTETTRLVLGDSMFLNNILMFGTLIYATYEKIHLLHIKSTKL